MSVQLFNAKLGPILVDAEATGPARGANLRLLVDTGATTSLINLSTAIYLGLDPDQPLRTVRMTTGSAVEVVPVVMLTRLAAFGQQRIGFPVLAHALPDSPDLDGLLGLDFVRGQILTIDFRVGQITLS